MASDKHIAIQRKLAQAKQEDLLQAVVSGLELLLTEFDELKNEIKTLTAKLKGGAK